MTQEELAGFRLSLHGERERIIRVASYEREEQRQREHEIGDSLDDSSEESIASTHLRLRDREKFLFNKIDSALARVEAGTFGLCVECEEEISVRRLKARPVAELCIDCKQEAERSERLDPASASEASGGVDVDS